MSETKKDIAARVKELRECCEVKVEVIANIAGLSVDDYSKMEKGEIDFPASSLFEIANALNTDLTELLTGRPAHLNSFCVTRNGMGTEVKRRKDYGYENLAASFIHKKCEPFIVSVPVSETEPALNAHPGQEFVYMLEGSMLIKVAENELTLNPGDSIYIDSTKPHSMKSIGDTPARFLDVIL